MNNVNQNRTRMDSTSCQNPRIFTSKILSMILTIICVERTNLKKPLIVRTTNNIKNNNNKYNTKIKKNNDTSKSTRTFSFR